MTSKNQNIKTIIEYKELSGVGTVAVLDGYRDVLICGLFKRHRYTFIVHRAVGCPSSFTVSEASTGYRVKDAYYPSIESALIAAMNILDEKMYCLPTTIGNTLVKTKVNLSKRNCSPFTLAISSLLI